MLDKEWKWECRGCGHIARTSTDQEPEECHSCGSHLRSSFELAESPDESKVEE